MSVLTLSKTLPQEKSTIDFGNLSGLATFSFTIIMIIPSTQKAAVLRGVYGKYHIIDADFAVPQPGPEEALVRLEASGICHGDVNPRDGYPPAPLEPVRPLVTGHEGIGQVVAMGESITDFKIGDLVGMGWRHSTCLSCKQCKQGYSNLCPSVVLNGYTQDGTFQGQ